MDGLIAPHGGSLIDRSVGGREAAALAGEAGGLAKLTLTARTLSDLEMLATGAFSPLTGFLGRKDAFQ